MKGTRDYVFLSDNTCDLPEDVIKELGISCISLAFEVDGVVFSGEKTLPIKDFYVKMRAGSSIKTSQISPDSFEEVFSKIVKSGRDVLYVGFSSGLSGTLNSARVAQRFVSERFPNAKIRIVDSLCASTGEGLLVYHAAMMKKEGKTIDEVTDWLEKNKLHLCHLFTVDDLMFLHRGGRVSKTSAIAGSILGIKPVLHVDNDGHLIPLSKVRGRKQSLNWLVDKMGERIGKWDNKIFAICHGDCIEDAEYVAKLVRDKYGIKKCIISYTGTVIGAHSGPGTIALFFLGDYR
ncbi:MAG: DegV family protein [Oscillospiraceae bacterium]|jgi:DegV family protein with EDD domain